ncbi:MAG TPA: DsrE family protein [Bryobacteraceae bacterium]|nr:DsrE family protein [Bryobacteraceae bacterium]
MHVWINPVAILAVSIGLASPTFAQSGKPLAVPGAAVAKEVPDAKELPDPNMTYKVLFDVSQAAPKPDQVIPILEAVARYLNTLDKWGVPPEHRKLAVIFHQTGIQAILNNDAYKERTGKDNPNAALLEKLNKAGVELHACGQGMLANKIEPAMVLPGINVDLWALVSIVNFEMRGYARIGN